MSQEDFWFQLPEMQGEAALPDWEDWFIEPTSEPALGFEVG
jgi:hypothetical protein